MKKYRLALINPKGVFLGRNKALREFSNDFPRYKQNWSGFNSGLLIIAALTPDNFEMKFIDENYEEINWEEEFDLVCLSILTPEALRGYHIADNFRKRGVKTIIGGIHASIMPEEVKQHADSVVIGEVEDVWTTLIEDFINNRLQPFYKASNLVDPSKIPIPRFDLLTTQNYKMVWIQSSRGCPFDCGFCVASNIYGRKHRYKKIERVIRELEIVKNKWERVEIGFGDDNMFVNKKYSIELLKEVKPLKIKWFVNCDISVTDDDNFLDLLQESGCKYLFIGFETVSEDGLKSISAMDYKINYLKRYSSAVQKIQSYGIGVIGGFIVGLDSDDFSSFDQVAEFIINNNLYAPQITILTPYPGTKVREELVKEKRILPTTWDNYTCLDVNFMPAKMSPKELEEGLAYIYRRIYDPEVRVANARYFKDVYLNLKKRDKKGHESYLPTL